MQGKLLVRLFFDKLVMAEVSSHLTQLGFKVLVVPEAATMMMKGGAFIETRAMTFLQAVKFQISIMKT